MTGEEYFIILCSIILSMGLLAILYLFLRDMPKERRKPFLMICLSSLYRVSGMVGLGIIFLCFVFPERAGTLQISVAVIALIIHFALMFVDGIKTE